MTLPDRGPYGVYEMAQHGAAGVGGARPDVAPLQGGGRASSSDSVSVLGRDTAGMSTRELQRVAKARASMLFADDFNAYASGGEDVARTPSPDGRESLGEIAQADQRRARPQPDYAAERPLAAVNRFSRSFDASPVIRSSSALNLGQLDISDPWGLTWDSSSPYDALAAYMQPKRSSMALGGRRPSSVASSPAESTSVYPWSSPSASTSTSTSQAPSAASHAATVSLDRGPSSEGHTSPLPSSLSLPASPPLQQHPQLVPPATIPPRRRVASFGAVETANRAQQQTSTRRTRSKMDVETRPDPETPKLDRKRSRNFLSIFQPRQDDRPAAASTKGKHSSRSSRGSSLISSGGPTATASAASTRPTSPSGGHSHPGRGVSDATGLPSLYPHSGAVDGVRKSRSSFSLLFFGNGSSANISKTSKSSDSISTRSTHSSPAPPRSIASGKSRVSSPPTSDGGSVSSRWRMSPSFGSSMSLPTFATLKRRDSGSPTPPMPPPKERNGSVAASRTLPLSAAR